MRIANSLGLTAIVALCVGASAALSAIPDGDWRTINRDLASTRFSPLKDIDRTNVSKLGLAWSYPMKAYNTVVPLVIDGTMYFTAGNRIVSVDASTGKELWSYTVERDPKAGPGGGGVSTRGVGYWAGDAKTPPHILVMLGSRMLALGAADGKPVASFGTGGFQDVGVSFGGTPTVAGDVAIIGAATTENPVGVAGNERAFDARTGKKLWEFQTVPLPGQKGHETWLDAGWKGRSGTNQWGFSAPVDEARGVVYVPLGSPSPNYWGGSRPGNNLYGNSVVALDVKTGKYLWHYQTVHHDLWDSDMPTVGPVIDLKVNGKARPGIVEVGKTSYFYEFDRVSGKPLFPVVERAVPKGNVPGEYYSPTQPIPAKTPPLSRVAMTKADIVTGADTTPEHAAACQAMWDKAGGYQNSGTFTPFMYHEEGAAPKSSIQFPGGIGGVNWGGPAADPTTGWVYVNAHDTSLVGWVEKKDPNIEYSFDAPHSDQLYDRASVDGKGPFFAFQAPISGKYDEKHRPVGQTAPCYKGPWARLTAIDANTGEIKFAVPLGLIEGLPEGKQLMGDTGSAGPTVTGGGLVFVGATNDKRFRAFDSTTGKQLWEAKIGNNANANPISYRGRDGKQYVAINAGGTIVAYSLQ
jgi:quinoprotein glucose dehydrogenase